MANGRQYHMNTDSRQHWMDDALRRVAAEQQRNPDDRSLAMARALTPEEEVIRDAVLAERQESATGWLGDLVGAIKDFRLPEGPRLPGVRTPLNPSGTLGGGVNMLKDMLISTGEDFGAEGAHKDTPIPMGKLAMAGLLPLKGIRKVAKSLIGGADEAVTTGSRVGLDPKAVDDIVAGRTRSPRGPLDVEPQWADDLLPRLPEETLAAAEPVAQTSKISDLPPLPDTTASGRPILGMGANRAPVTPKTDAAGKQIQSIFSGMSDAMGGGALADALGPASRGVSKIDDTLLPRLPGEGDEAAATLLGRDEFGSYKKPEPKLGDPDYVLKAGDPGYQPRLDPSGRVSIFEGSSGKINLPKKAFSVNVDDLTRSDVRKLIDFRDEALGTLRNHSRGIREFSQSEIGEALDTIKTIDAALVEKGYLKGQTYVSRPAGNIGHTLDDFPSSIDDLVTLPGRSIPLSSVRPLAAQRNDLVRQLKEAAISTRNIPGNRRMEGNPFWDNWQNMNRNPNVKKMVDEIVELEEKLIRSGWVDEASRTTTSSDPSGWKVSIFD